MEVVRCLMRRFIRVHFVNRAKKLYCKLEVVNSCSLFRIHQFAQVEIHTLFYSTRRFIICLLRPECLINVAIFSDSFRNQLLTQHMPS